ncbi:MAG: acyltransferase [Patescibacteria group bacterium]
MYSLVNKFVTLGSNVTIWNFCNIYGTKTLSVTIGSNTQIGSYCEIKSGVHIGKDCRIQASVFISDMTNIGNGVFIGPHAIFLNDKYPDSKTARLHKSKYNPSNVNDGTVIGGGAIIGPGVTIGKNAIIGMGAVVTKDVPNNAIVVGNPACPIKK